MAAQVHAEVAVSDSKLAQRWAKLVSRQLKMSPGCPKVGHNCCQVDSRWLQYCMKAGRKTMPEKPKEINDFQCFCASVPLNMGPSWPRFAQVGDKLAQGGCKLAREGPSWHQDSPSWCQHGPKMAKVEANMASWQSKCTPKWP